VDCDSRNDNSYEQVSRCHHTEGEVIVVFVVVVSI